LFSLMRNLGSSIGISIVVSLLAHKTQINHATLAEHATPFNPTLQVPGSAAHWGLTTPSGLMSLNAEITRQAATIAYLDDFRLMMWVMLLAIPLLFLLRRPPARGTAPAAAAAAAD
jgi:MFS transporter, DHA2 family, multidrug resistance protein